MERIQNILLKIVKFENIFQKFVDEIAYTPTNIRELKSYTKVVGDIWEDFSIMYLQKMYNMKVFKIKDCPIDILLQLNLRRQDVGIDLIGIDSDDEYFAIQCKYRKSCKALSWRDVSTFDALCMRSGPWKKCIVMTTSSSIKREGITTSKDVFWGNAHFRNMSRYDWMAIGGFSEGHCCGGSKNDNIHEARLKYFA